jgi:protein SCO1/2
VCLRQTRFLAPRFLAPLALAGALSLLDATAPKPGAARRGRTGRRFHAGDQAGKTVHAADFAGRYTVFYFGYTFCPDVCPLDTANLMQGYHALPRPPGQGRASCRSSSRSIRRAIRRKCCQFTGNFGKELVGLTGTPAQIAAVAKEYAVYYQKRPAPRGPRPKPI